MKCKYVNLEQIDTIGIIYLVTNNGRPNDLSVKTFKTIQDVESAIDSVNPDYKLTCDIRGIYANVKHIDELIFRLTLIN